MKNPFVIVLLTLAGLWYAAHVLIWRAYGGTWTDAFLWPLKRIKSKFTTPAPIAGAVDPNT